MIEPRSVRFHLRRRRPRHSEEEQETAILMEHDEPEHPIHPGFEYETEALHYVSRLSERSQQSIAEENEARRRRNKSCRRRAYLLASIVLMLVAGTGHCVSLKLQAMPMYV